ncbi:unnamed protein product [Dibothriocephalus latus]|uniref:MAM domain-containing protein n=1 Tax=Dibothriocephalus latus TaxID=60516 RepID=A0A3P7MIB0_DIBLA|nr:unnamed protein product [Dibothriocephalus latus]
MEACSVDVVLKMEALNKNGPGSEREMLVLLDLILLAVVASCSDPTIRPVALCNFDQHTCGWTNDPSSSLHSWKIQQRPARGLPTDPAVTYPILCFSANAQAEEDKDATFFSSWLTVPSKPLVKKPPVGDLRARLWSPTIPAALSLRCLKFSYTYVDQPKASRHRQPSNRSAAALALLKQADGCLLIAIIVYRTTSNPTIRPVAVCNFDQHTCGWTNDPSSSLHPWKIEQRPARGLPTDPAVTYPVLCFSANAQSEEDKDAASFNSWLSVPRKHKVKKPQVRDLRARLWSPGVPAELGLRCLKFSYTFVDEPKTSRLRQPSNRSTAALALLKQADGCLVIATIVFRITSSAHALQESSATGLDSTIRPVALCNFDQDTCGWTNDPSSSLYPWKIQNRPPKGFPSTDPTVAYPVLCFSANSQAEEDKDAAPVSSWLSVPRKPKVKKPRVGDLRARLWSPSVPAELGLRCLKFSYTFVDQPKASRPRQPSSRNPAVLALLKQADGCLLIASYLNPSSFVAPPPFHTHCQGGRGRGQQHFLGIIVS